MNNYIKYFKLDMDGNKTEIKDVLEEGFYIKEYLDTGLYRTGPYRYEGESLHYNNDLISSYSRSNGISTLKVYSVTKENINLVKDFVIRNGYEFRTISDMISELGTSNLQIKYSDNIYYCFADDEWFKEKQGV